MEIYISLAEVAIPAKTSYAEIEEIRRKRFNRISDEALIELDQITYLLKKARVENSPLPTQQPD